MVEHHGGPKRLARLRAVIRPSRVLYWFQACLALAAMTMGAIGLPWALAVCLAFLGLLWIGPLVEADRLERVLHAAAEQVVDRLREDEERAAGAQPQGP